MLHVLIRFFFTRYHSFLAIFSEFLQSFRSCARSYSLSLSGIWFDLLKFVAKIKNLSIEINTALYPHFGVRASVCACGVFIYGFVYCFGMVGGCARAKRAWKRGARLECEWTETMCECRKDKILCYTAVTRHYLSHEASRINYYLLSLARARAFFRTQEFLFLLVLFLSLFFSFQLSVFLCCAPRSTQKWMHTYLLFI